MSAHNGSHPSREMARVFAVLDEHLRRAIEAAIERHPGVNFNWTCFVRGGVVTATEWTGRRNPGNPELRSDPPGLDSRAR